VSAESGNTGIVCGTPDAANTDVVIVLIVVEVIVDEVHGLFIVSEIAAESIVL